MKKVLTIAGSDCSGGAGIQADIKTISAHGCYAMSVIVSVVAENTNRVIDIQNINTDIIEKQIDAIYEDIEIDAIKIGMLNNEEIMSSIAKKIKQLNLKNIVIDPVMYATNGAPLMSMNSIDALIKLIIPLATVLTPNIPEAEKISNMKITTIKDMEESAIKIYKMGCKNVLIKGGHLNNDATDILYDGNEFNYFKSSKIETKNTHGTGCTLSSSIASNIALGYPIKEAITKSKEYITTVIKHSLPIGKGHGPTNHFYELYKNNNMKTE